VNDLIRLENHGRIEDLCLHFLRLHVKLETPFCHALLVEKLFAHVLDLLDLLGRRNSGALKSVAHTFTLADIIRDTIDEAELWRKVETVFTCSYLEERLLWLVDLHLICLFKVISDSDLFSLVSESHTYWACCKVNIADDIGTLVTPIGNDSVTAILKLDHLFPMVLVLGVLFELINLLQTSAS